MSQFIAISGRYLNSCKISPHFDILKMPLYQNGSGWNRSPTSFFVKFFKTYQKLPRPHFDKKLQNKRTELK